MSQTLIPTMRLRWNKRVEVYTSYSKDESVKMGKYVNVLQQRFEQPNGKEVWVDIPTTESE